MTETRRAQPRVDAVIPVNVDGLRAGTTRDVSREGVFFETDTDMRNGSAIHFSLEYGGKVMLDCAGEIVRVVHVGEKIGVAARILHSHIERHA